MSSKFENYSNASRLRQSKIPKHIRVARMKAAAKSLHASRTPDERRTLAYKMIAAKQALKKKPNESPL